MMQDFRDSQQYQIFIACRLNREKFNKLIESQDWQNIADRSVVKRAAIEALAYNESCLLSARQVDISGSESLKEAGYAAFVAYKKRADAENGVLTEMITGHFDRAGEHMISTYSLLADEKSKFYRLSNHQKGHADSDTPIAIYLFAVLLAGLMLKAFLKEKNSNEDVIVMPQENKKKTGAIRASFGFFKGIYSGLKSDVQSIKNGVNKDKEEDNV